MKKNYLWNCVNIVFCGAMLLSLQLKAENSCREVKLLASDEYAQFLDKSKVTFNKIAESAKLFKDDKQILVIEGNKNNLDLLTSQKDKLTKSCEQGNWVMIVGLEPDALDKFNQLTGLKQTMRPFRIAN